MRPFAALRHLDWVPHLGLPSAMLACLLLSSCGGGIIAVIIGSGGSSSSSSGGGGGGGVVEGKPQVAEVTVASGSPLRGNLSLRFRLVDSAGQRSDVRVRYSLDGGASFPFEPTLDPSASRTTDLVGSASGVWYPLLWDSATDLPLQRQAQVRVRVTPLSDGNPIGPNASETPSFAIDNSAAPEVQLQEVRASNGSTALHGTVEIEFSIQDAEEDRVDVELRVQRDGGSFAALDGIAESLQDLPSGPIGAPLSYVATWNSAVDVPGQASVVLRAEARDTQTSSPSDLGPYAVDNTTSEILDPTVAPGPLFDVVQLDYRLRDDGSDPLDVELLYSIDGGDPALLASFASGRGAESPVAQSSSPSGEPHAFVWDAARDLGVGARTNELRLRLRARDALTNISVVTAPLGPLPYDGTRVATAAGLEQSIGVVAGALVRDADGTLIFVNEADPLALVIQRFDPRTSSIVTLAGGGPNTGDDVAALEAHIVPTALAIDTSGDVWFLEDVRVRRVRGIRSVDPRVETYAGGGSSTADLVDRLQAQLAPTGIAVESQGAVIVADLAAGARLRRIDPLNGTIDTLALRDPQGLPVTLVDLGDVEVDSLGSLYFTEPLGNRVWFRDNVAVANRTFPIAGDGTQGFRGDGGPATSAQLDTPFQLTLDASGRILVHDRGNFRVRRIGGGTIQTILGGGPSHADQALGTDGELYLRGLNARGTRGAFVAHISGDIARLSEWSDLDQRARARIGAAGATASGSELFTVPLAAPSDLIAPARDLAFVIEDERRILRLDRVTGIAEAIAGSGVLVASGDGGDALLAGMNPVALAYDGAATLYFVDRLNHGVRRIDLSSSIVDTLPIALDPTIYPPPLDQLQAPNALAIDAAGDLYVCDSGNHRVVKLLTASNAAEVLAGDGVAGASGDGGLAIDARLESPRGLFLDGASNIYVLDQGRIGFNSMRVRRIEVLSGVIDTVAGGGTLEPDGVPATQANLRRLAGGCASGGALLLTSFDLRAAGNLTPRSIVRVDLTRDLATRDCGVLDPAAGRDEDGVVASELYIDSIERVTVGFDGEILFSQPARGTLRRYVPEHPEGLRAPARDQSSPAPACPTDP